MIKRYGLMIVVNILIMVTISVTINLLGIRPYLSSNGINFEHLMYFCLIWGMGGSFISLMLSKFMAKKMMGVQIVEENDHRFGAILTKVHRLAKQAGIDKMPEVGVYESPEINAFATGPSKNNSLVAISTGLLEKMSDEEVEGVLAHEIAHIANGDMITMTLVQGVINAFVMFLSRVIAYFIDQALRSDDEDGKGLGFFAYTFTVIGLDIFLGLLALPIVSWFSRYREYRADEGGAKLAGKQKMISALEALQRNYPALEEATHKDSSIKAMQISSKTSFSELISTHPTLDKRIEALRSNPSLF